MSDLKIEWVFPDDLYERDVEGSSVPVVHLKQVDALIGEMVRLAEACSKWTPYKQPEYMHAIHVLDSPLVQAWRERQKEQ